VNLMWQIEKKFQKGNLLLNVDHISRTLNQFELHQYLVFLLRKTQNACLIWQIGKLSQKENFLADNKKLFLDHVSLSQLYHLMYFLCKNKQNINSNLKNPAVFLEFLLYF